MGMFCKHSPDLVFGLGHPPVQLHPVLLLQGNPLPGTGILLLWLFGSLVALQFHHPVIVALARYLQATNAGIVTHFVVELDTVARV